MTAVRAWKKRSTFCRASGRKRRAPTTARSTNFTCLSFGHARSSAHTRRCGAASCRRHRSRSAAAWGLPILASRISLDQIAERWNLYREGLEEGGHDAETRSSLLRRAAVWRNVHVADSHAQAEDELAAMLGKARSHMMHVRSAYNPQDFQVDPAMLNAWSNPAVSNDEALPQVLETGSVYGTPARVREQLAALRDAGARHVLCQLSFGDVAHDRVMASMRLFGEEVIPALRSAE